MHKAVFNIKEVQTSKQTVQWSRLSQGNCHEMLLEKCDYHNQFEKADSV